MGLAQPETQFSRLILLRPLPKPGPSPELGVKWVGFDHLKHRHIGTMISIMSVKHGNFGSRINPDSIQRQIQLGHNPNFNINLIGFILKSKPNPKQKMPNLSLGSSQAISVGCYWAHLKLQPKIDLNNLDLKFGHLTRAHF